MAEFNYALQAGWNITNPTNIEDIVSEAPHILPDQLMPAMGPIKTRALSGKARRDGVPSVIWQWDKMLRTDFDVLIITIWGDYSTASAKVTTITRGADNQYTTYNAYAEQPVTGDDYRSGIGAVYVLDVRVPIFAATAIGEFDSGFSLAFTV